MKNFKCSSCVKSVKGLTEGDLERAVPEYKMRVQKGRAVGYIDGTIEISDRVALPMEPVAFVVRDMKANGQTVEAECEALDTPMGRQLQKMLMEHGKDRVDFCLFFSKDPVSGNNRIKTVTARPRGA